MRTNPNEKHRFSAIARAHPSLALVKYWGKLDAGTNLPAVPSVAVTLDTLETRTAVSVNREADSVSVDGILQEPGRFRPVLDAIRSAIRSTTGFAVESRNTFPTAAGLASSASGFAALVAACVAAAGRQLPPDELSRLARIGSGSAARSVFGGFTVWETRAPSAYELHGADWWPELRIVVVPVTSRPKAISSRQAMEHTRATSPYFDAWTLNGPSLAKSAIDAIEHRDLDALGHTARLSYLRMFATMIAADPPVEYWEPDSIVVQRAAADLRKRGVPAWETMDAGPQVKILTDSEHANEVVTFVKGLLPVEPVVCKPGPGVSVEIPG